MGEAAPQGAASCAARWWCRWCGRQVTVTGADPQFAKAIHMKTGSETGPPDGHVAAPIDYEPPMWKAARELADDYHGAFTLSARFGILRADWSAKAIGPGVTAAHYTAPDEEDMRRQLDAAVAGTRWERSREGAGS
jgi:hypothetical protein